VREASLKRSVSLLVLSGTPILGAMARLLFIPEFALALALALALAVVVVVAVPPLGNPLPLGAASAALLVPMTLEVFEGELATEPETYETFEVFALNTNESVRVVMHGDVPTPDSSKALDHLFRCLRTEREAHIDDSLTRVMFALARESHGTLELISGYRAPRHLGDRNYHSRAQAADLRVRGVPRQVLFALARKLNIPGLGIYPTSGMIHIDMRDEPYRWIDYSGPAR
jgi:uncharacterized protein YcbK (DUF882 family)